MSVCVCVCVFLCLLGYPWLAKGYASKTPNEKSVWSPTKDEVQQTELPAGSGNSDLLMIVLPRHAIIIC